MRDGSSASETRPCEGYAARLRQSADSGNVGGKEEICGNGRLRCRRIEEVPMHFTVGFRLKGHGDRVTIDAEDALIAALRVKAERPEAVITYVRHQNKRGDTRHPSHSLEET
jgi:hypothetical protein